MADRDTETKVRRRKLNVAWILKHNVGAFRITAQSYSMLTFPLHAQAPLLYRLKSLMLKWIVRPADDQQLAIE